MKKTEFISRLAPTVLKQHKFKNYRRGKRHPRPVRFCRRDYRLKRIGVLYGGWSAERPVSLNSGKNVIAALESAGFNVIPFDIHRDFVDKLSKLKLDLAFIALHGTYGEDGRIQSVLDIMGIPYTGSNALASMLAMNKIVAKKIFQWHDIPTPEWIEASRLGIGNWKLEIGKLKYPVVVKPATQGSAIGVSIVKNSNQMGKALELAFKYDDNVIVEKYISGKELTVGILCGELLPVIEIIPVGSEFYDYRAKYAAGGSRHIIPAQISRDVSKKVQILSKAAFDVLGCSGVARVDIMLDRNNNPYILEVNTIPGLTKTSLLPDAAREAGYSFENLILKLIEYSMKHTCQLTGTNKHENPCQTVFSTFTRQALEPLRKPFDRKNAFKYSI